MASDKLKKIKEILGDHEKRIKKLEGLSKKVNSKNPVLKSDKDFKKKSKKFGYGEKIDEILKLKTSGFFKTHQTPQKIKDDLRRRGKKRLCKSIEVTLLRLVDRGELKRREGMGKKGKRIWEYYS